MATESRRPSLGDHSSVTLNLITKISNAVSRVYCSPHAARAVTSLQNTEYRINYRADSVFCILYSVRASVHRWPEAALVIQLLRHVS